VTVISTFAIPAGYTAPENITNTATISSATPDPAGPNQVSAGVPLSTSADLVIAKSGDPLAVPGTRTSYTITVRNDGPSDARNVVVNDTTPAGLSFVSNSGDCATSFPCALGTLAAGQTMTITARYDIDANYIIVQGTDPITNTATVASSTADPNWPNTASAGTPTEPLADLTLSKRVEGASALTFGDVLTFNLVLRNDGPSNATNVVVSETLPAGLELIDASATQGIYSSTTGTWVSGDLAPGDVLTLAVYARVSALGLLTNTAQVAASGQRDPDALAGNSVPGEDDQSSASITVTEIPALAVSKHADIVSNGDATYDVTFSFIVSNTGNVPLNTLRLEDNLLSAFPAPTRFAIRSSPSVSGALSANAGFDGVGDTLIANGSLAHGQHAAISFTLHVTPLISAIYSNAASISARGPGGTPTSDVSNSGNTPEPGVDSPTLINLPIADLHVIKQTDNPQPNAGDVFNYVVVIANRGPSTAYSVRVTETLPTAMGYQTHTVSAGSYADDAGIWSIAALSSGEQATLTLAVRTNATGEAVNRVAAVSNTPDPDLTNNSASVRTPQQVADVSVRKTVNAAQIVVGQEVTYTITLRNDGPDAATNILVRDMLPAGLRHMRHLTSTGDFAADSGNWAIPRLAAGDDAVLTLVARVEADGVLTNTVEIIRVDQDDPDSDAGNGAAGEDDQASVPVRSATAARLTLSKAASTNTVRIGDTITYTLAVRNTGGSPASGITVRDAVPAATEFVSANLGGENISGVATWRMAQLAAGDTITVLLVVRVTNTPNAVSIRNTATVEGQSVVDAVSADSNEVQNPFMPTAISLAQFEALPDAAGARILWRTSLERETLGFNVLRSATGTRAEARRVNGVLIPATGLGSGAFYELRDRDAAPGTHYWLEEIDLNGRSAEYGPVLLKVPVLAQPDPVANTTAGIVYGGVRLELAPVVAAQVERGIAVQRVVEGSSEPIAPRATAPDQSAGNSMAKNLAAQPRNNDSNSGNTTHNPAETAPLQTQTQARNDAPVSAQPAVIDTTQTAAHDATVSTTAAQETQRRENATAIPWGWVLLTASLMLGLALGVWLHARKRRTVR
jgi:uncharacterized repeat protein (TIGR01451 family)